MLGNTKKWTFALLFWFAFSSFLLAQTEFDERFLDPENENSLEFLELLDYLQKHPLDINTATKEQMETIPFFNPSIVKKIVHERTRRGPFRNVQDFQYRLALHENEIERIAPYIRFSRISDLEMDNRMHIVQELPLPEGIYSGKYKGPWYKSTFRMEWNYANRIAAGLLIQKDPGEPQWNDHTVGFLQANLFKNQNTDFSIVLGNFLMEIGQGLVLWGPYGLFKGSDPIAFVKKRNRGIKGYISSDESKALQGSAFCVKIRNMEFTGFFSCRRLDASIQPNGTVSGLETSGFHRTQSEIEKSNTLQEILFGTRGTFSFSKGRFGMTMWRGKYDHPFLPLDQERNRFGFRGKSNQLIGIDWDFHLGPCNWFGEMARSLSKGMAWMGGGIVSLKAYEFAFLIRHYDPLFHNHRANGFGSSIPENETGGYIGARLRIAKTTDFLFYFDLYRRPWRTYFFPLPTSGIETFAGFQSQWTKEWSTYWGVKIQEKEMRNLENSPPFVFYTRTRYQCELHVKPTPYFRVRSGVEGTALKYPKFPKEEPFKNEKGILMFEDLQWQFKPKWEFGFRWSTFDTDSYESRLYVFEYDFPSVYTLLPCYKKGERFSIRFHWKINSHWNASCKYALTTHLFVNSWGTGENCIPQNREKMWGTQLDWKK